MGQAWDDHCEVERLTSRVKTLWDSRQKWKKRALAAEAELKKCPTLPTKEISKTDAAIFVSLRDLGHQGHVTEKKHTSESLYTVRLYDGMDNCWMDVKADMPLAEAYTLWMKETRNGSRCIKYDDIDYYAIYPADTRMIRAAYQCVEI